MLRLPTVKFWRNAGWIVLFICLCAALLGTFGITGPVAYHWGADAEPNAFGGIWMTWAMLLLTGLSLFAVPSLMKPKAGQSAVHEETACAFAVGLMSIFTGVNLIVVLYAFYPVPVVPAAGTIGILLVFVLDLILAAVRKRRS